MSALMHHARIIFRGWIIFGTLLCFFSNASAHGVQLSRSDYASHLRAMWLGESIANWTGLNTEGQRPGRPFYTDADWGTDQGNFGTLEFILQDPWGSDDDTDIEYVYLHLMNQHDTNLLSPVQIADGWKEHINDFIWVSNRQARDWMELGVLPPATGMGVVNSDYLMIDAQLTTEFFGAIAPGMPQQALQLADLPIRTTAAGYAAHAAQFFTILYALAPLVDQTQTGREQVIWLVKQARQYIPSTSKTAEIADFVLADFLSNPDADNWERTRDRVYNRYHRSAFAQGYIYQAWWESSVNFATGLIALLYGKGDFKRTVQIGTLTGWDSDNGTATMGGLLGLMQGYDALVAQFPDVTLSDRYNIYRTRDNLPDYLPDDAAAEDTFTMMAKRMLPLVERTIVEAGGAVEGDTWTLPEQPAGDPLLLNPVEQDYQRSINNQVLLSGGTIETRIINGESQDNPRVFADGIEHNFSGVERLAPIEYLTAKAQDGTIGFEVHYDQTVEVQTIRFIEGDQVKGTTGFTSVMVEIKVFYDWQAVSPDVTASVVLDTHIPFQIIDFTLEMPITVTGIRVTGTTETANAPVTIAELDALAPLP